MLAVLPWRYSYPSATATAVLQLSECYSWPNANCDHCQMEFVDMTLREYIDQTSLLAELPASQELWDIFGQLLIGIGYLHSKGLIHRCG